MNYKVDMSKEPSRSVAGDFLEVHNILRSINRTNNLILSEIQKKKRGLPNMPSFLKDTPPPVPKECTLKEASKRLGLIETMLEEEVFSPDAVIKEVRALRKLLNQLV
jgi:hypothetical protein